MADNEIVYEIQANPKKVTDAIDKIDGDAAKAAAPGGGVGKLNTSIASIGTVAVAAAAAYSTYLVAGALRAGVDAAIETEAAVNRMNNALSLAGRLSVESSADMNAYASQIQKTTTIADDAALSYLALATIYTKTNEQTKQLTMAAINLSTAMGTSVDTAVRQLGASLGGTVGLLGKVIPEVRNLTEEQLKAGAAIDIVSKKFEGSAQNAALTFSGRMAQLRNNFGDVLEEVGFFITKSDSLGKAMGYLSTETSKFAVQLGVIRENSGDLFKPLLENLGYFALGVVRVFGPAVELIIKSLNMIGTLAAQVSAGMVQMITGDFKGAFEVLSDTNLAETLNFSELFSFEGTKSAANFVAGFIEQVQMSQGLIADAIPPNMNAPKLGPDETEKEKIIEDISLIGIAYDGFIKKIEISKARFAAASAEIRKNLFANIVNGVQTAMNAVGSALVNGGNALTAFGKAMLGMFGQLANQLGMFYFLLGLATVYNDPARGAGMIAGGLALMVLGGVLSALGGGASGGATSGGASAGAATSNGSTFTEGVVGDNTTAFNDTEERQRATNITVNIEGNVLGDKRTLGVEIADALNEAFGNDGIIIARGAIS